MLGIRSRCTLQIHCGCHPVPCPSFAHDSTSTTFNFVLASRPTPKPQCRMHLNRI
ncbi:hypothetical protein IscW_ISCW004479 [Ixodes scapularis]|uniref:Uncharacterized protein n=1 Tax=Ixodes scapularis TaxID=6945 RepID=B7PHT3_IXOSC|nr:hypothetical protein IscW_ISCW004479 [Ixodes scapularis]|eukprot:XP_002403499.1 hypothetical protein IscW_ISCW004479 [Ixodes scapularis]